MSAAYPAGVQVPPPTIGQPVQFRVPAGVEIAGVLVEDLGGSVVVEVDTETWDFIDTMWVFGLDPANRLPGKVSGEQPVRIELRPLPGSPADGVGNLAGSLVQRSAEDPRDELLVSTAWQALAVTETVRDEGVLQLRSGFTTCWRGGRAVHPLLDDLTAFFTVSDVPIDRVDGPHPVLSGEGDGEHGSWLLTVRADEASREVTLESVTAALDAGTAGRLAAAVGDAVDARVAEGRLAVTHRWAAPQGPLDEDGFADALADHLSRMDALLAHA